MDPAAADEERLCGDALAVAWADTAARALCDRVHATLHGGASLSSAARDIESNLPRLVALLRSREREGGVQAAPTRRRLGALEALARCVGSVGIGASPTGRRGNSEVAGVLWRDVDAALADAAAALRSSLDARATAAKKSARKSAAAAAAAAYSQPSGQEQLDDAMGQHWDLSDDIGKVLAFHLSHAPDTASAARRQMSTGAVCDACHACAGGLGAPAAESLWRCVTLAAGAHAPCGVAARAVPGFAETFRDARRCALRGSAAAAPLLLPDGGTSALLACVREASASLAGPMPTDAASATAPHRVADSVAEALELRVALLRCADSAGRSALVGDTALDSELVTLRSPVSTALRERTRALEEKEASEEENGSSSTDDDKRYALLRRFGGCPGREYGVVVGACRAQERLVLVRVRGRRRRTSRGRGWRTTPCSSQVGLASRLS
ncbi:Oxidoreductase NAD-binding domain-containing protein 1 [Pycnococcus provasolii]